MYQTGKKLLSLLLAISMLLALCVTAGAKEDGVTVTLDGELLAAEAYIDANGRTQVSAAAAEKLGIKLTLKAGDAAGDTTVVDGYFPLRYVAEANGYQVAWDAASRTAKLTSATDLDSIETLEIDWSQAAQLPLTGYFTKSFDDGRSVKVYIAEEASIRSYFTVVAVPDGVNTKEFLESEGWFALADAKGEGLFVLEPGKDGWGSAADESGYVNEAVGFLKGGKNAKGVAVFTTFGEFYLAGYGKGAAALELWAAENPIFVIAQAYVNGESAGEAALTAVASELYTGKSNSGDISDVLDATLKTVGIGAQMAPKDVPVPTWFAGYTGSETYWKNANDCESSPVGGVYYQRIDSDGYATAFANEQRKAAGETHGLSQVKVSVDKPSASDIYAFFVQFSRYDTTFAYSNALSSRLDYTAAKVSAQQTAKTAAPVKLSDDTELYAQAESKITGHGTVQVGIFAFSDNNGDGKNDPREYLLYIPDGFSDKELPVLIVFPGNTQTDIIFMDSTSWWTIAEKEGVALAFVCETYSSPVAATHVDAKGYYQSLVTLLKEKIDGKLANLDFSRIYATGQSLGSNTAQGFAMTNPEFFAAVATTSGTPIPKGHPDSGSFDPVMVTSTEPVGKLIPAMMITGQMDSGSMAKGFDSPEDCMWANYMLESNGFSCKFLPDTATGITELDSRHESLYTWSRTVDDVEIPLVQWAKCLLRPHNCYPSDMPILWDYLEHFSFEVAADGTVTRYYSASAFAADDAVVIK